MLNSLPHHLPNPNDPPPRNGTFDLRFGSSNMTILEFRDYLVHTSRVDLSYSQIETVSPLLQTENITFRWIALQGNTFRCDCDQSWLVNWLKSLGDALQQPDSVLCHSPDGLSGRRIISLHTDDFCPNYSRQRLLSSLKVCPHCCLFKIYSDNVWLNLIATPSLDDLSFKSVSCDQRVFLPRDAMLARLTLWPCVCMCLYLLHIGILLK